MIDPVLSTQKDLRAILIISISNESRPRRQGKRPFPSQDLGNPLPGKQDCAKMELWCDSVNAKFCSSIVPKCLEPVGSFGILGDGGEHHSNMMPQEMEPNGIPPSSYRLGNPEAGMKPHTH